MTSLLSLVREHGFGIKVQSTDPAFKTVKFTILKESDGKKDFYDVLFSDGIILEYKKDEPKTNDYEVIP